jgi:hypothetical protein
MFFFFGWLGVVISPVLLLLYVGGLGIYLFSNIFFTVKHTLIEKKGYLLLYLPFIFFIQHLAYGIGYLAGVINFKIIKKSQTTLITSR